MLPQLLQEISGKVADSSHRSDWREAEDPIWGSLYYVNKWSGNSGPEYDLQQQGVPRIDVVLTFVIHVRFHPSLAPTIEKQVSRILELEMDKSGFSTTVTQRGDNCLCTTVFPECSLQDSITEELRELTSNMGFQKRLSVELVTLPTIRMFKTDEDLDKVGVSAFMVTENEVLRAPRNEAPKEEECVIILSDDTKCKLEAVRWQQYTTLSFSQETFGLQGSEMLASVGSFVFAKLEELHLWSCQLRRAAQLIIDAIPPDTPLRILTLDDNDLEPLNWGPLAQTHIEELYIGNNPLLGARCADLAAVNSLKILDLSGCDVTDAVILCSMKLAKLFLRNNPLQNVDSLVTHWSKTKRENGLLDCRGVDPAQLPASMTRGILRS